MPVIPAVALDYRHVDVFATAAYSGNGLIVVFCDTLDRPAEQLRRIAEEMRQFETIFVAVEDGTTRVAARIFTVEEELPFAGHPVLGAAAALHERQAGDESTVEWQFSIGGRPLRVISERDERYFTSTMDQGPAQSSLLPDALRDDAAARLGLASHDLLPLPLQVVSTGLPYLIVPVTPAGLESARITGSRFEAWLGSFGAKFVYVLDPHSPEGRTWDNAGKVEDIATGSAAGPAAAYLFDHELAAGDALLHLAQGRFVGRPSTIAVTRDDAAHIWVGGPVRPVAAGRLDLEGSCASC